MNRFNHYNDLELRTLFDGLRELITLMYEYDDDLEPEDREQVPVARALMKEIEQELVRRST